MNIKLVLEVNGNIELSIDEARLLHGELGKLFGNQGCNSKASGPVERVAKQVAKQPMIKEAITSTKGETRLANQQAQKAAPGLARDTAESVPRKPKDRYANPRVEAAKERAASRTSGCGSRR